MMRFSHIGHQAASRGLFIKAKLCTFGRSLPWFFYIFVINRSIGLKFAFLRGKK